MTSTSSNRKVPRVSIGVPVYNGERYLREALDSILAQTFGDFELIISDNCSTDATAAICTEYAARDPRIRYVRQSENIGAGANFRYLLNAAVAPLFMWSAADDLCEPDMVERLVLMHDADPDVVLATLDILYIDGNGAAMDVTRLDTIRPDPVNGTWPAKRRRFFRVPTSNLCFAIYGLHRRSAMIEVGQRFGTQLRNEAGIENPMLAEIASRGRVVSDAAIGKRYRVHDDSTYIREIAAMRPLQRIDNHIDISMSLFAALRRSQLPPAEKLRLRLLMCWDLVVSTTRLAAGETYRALRRQVRQA